MTELIKYIVLQFAEKKDEVEFLEEENENLVTVTVVLNESDMGKVMGIASKKLAGTADGKSISDVVKKILA